MAQVNGYWPVISERRARSQALPWEDFGGHSGTGTDFFSPSTLVVPRQYHSTNSVNINIYIIFGQDVPVVY